MKVCVFGAGNMGARITEVFLNAGHDVTMIDIKPEFTSAVRPSSSVTTTSS